MAKLIAQLSANPTEATIAKVKAYARKHPMATCLLTAEQLAVLRAHGIVA